MNVEFDGTTCRVELVETYPTESAFWYALKLKLIEMGHDVIKKVMSRDGYMVGGDSYPYYIRERSWKWCIYDDLYQTQSVHERKNVNLTVENWS